MPWDCHFATIESDREIVVHMDEIIKHYRGTHDLDFVWLHQTLGIQFLGLDDIYAALALERNEPIARRIYENRFDALGGFITLPDFHPEFPREEIPLPAPETITDHTLLAEQLSLISFVEHWYVWPVPRGDFYLPVSEAYRVEYADTSRQAGRSGKCYEFADMYPPPAEAVAALEKATKALKNALEVEIPIERARASRVLALQKMRAVIELQTHHWLATDELGTALKQHALSDLDDAVRRLMSSAIEELRRPPISSPPARALLELLAKDSAVGAKISEALTRLADYDGAYGPAFVDRLFDALTNAFHILGQSALADEFLREHWMPLFEAACKNEPRRMQTVIDDFRDAELSAYWRGDWKKDVERLRQTLGKPKQQSSISPLFKAGVKLSNSMVGLVSAALSDSAILRIVRLIDREARVRGSVADLRFLSRAFLRFLFAQAVEHNAAKEPLLARGVKARDFLERVRAAPTLNPQEWAALGKKFNEEFEFSARWRRAPVKIGINLIAAAITLFQAFEPSSGNESRSEADILADAFTRVCSYLAGATAAAGAFNSLEEALTLTSKQLQGEARREVMKRFGQTSSKLAMLSGMFGILLSTIALYRDVKRSNIFGVGVNLAGLTASALTTAGALAALDGAMVLATALTGYGTIIGAVALVLALASPGDGPSELIDMYLRHAKEKNGPVAPQKRDIEFVDAMLKAAHSFNAFARFPEKIGKAGGSLGEKRPPTLHAARERGFEAEELRVLFNVSEVSLGVFKFANYPDPIRKEGE